MYIYARHLYSQKILRFQTDDSRFQLNKKIVYNFEPYVIFDVTTNRVNDYEKPKITSVKFDASGIQLKDDNIYLYGVTFEPNGKIYHYWSNNKYNIGDSVFIGDEQKEVEIVRTIHNSLYVSSLVNKFFPKENECLQSAEIWEYVVKNCNTEESLVVYNNKEMFSSWLYDKQSNSIYYVYKRKPIKTKFKTTFIARDLIEVKPFICRFINKDNSFSKKTYIYFTDNIGNCFKEYYTQYNQLLHYEGTCCLYTYDNLIKYAKEQDFELKFKHKELRRAAQEGTNDRLDALAYSFDTMASAAELATHSLNTLNTIYFPSGSSMTPLDGNRKTIPELLYGQSILNENEKENTTMNFMKNFEFGKINTSALKMSMCGLAFQRADKTYATYNVEDNSFTEVTDFLMDMDCVFVMPVAAKDIKAGDIVKHLNTYVVVKSINEDGSISAISPIKAEEICIIPTKNLFGFNYYSKVMNFFDGILKPTDENPFGNPMMLMMLFGDKMDFNGDMKSMLPLLLLNNQNGDMKDLMSNPLFFLAMTK